MSRARTNPWKVVTLILAGAIAVVVGTGSNDAQAKPANAEVLKVLGMLEAAKGQLFRAKKDEAGHRAKGIEATRMAITELRFVAFGKDASKMPFPK